MRKIIGYPFYIIGKTLFAVSELIMGEYVVYNPDKVLAIYKEKAKCSKCGHIGILHNNN